MGLVGFGKKKTPPAGGGGDAGSGGFGGRTVVIDNTSPDDNWIVNRTNESVSVACEEMFGAFAVHLGPGASRRVTTDVRANPYPGGNYSYDNLKYSLGKGETWEVRREAGGLVMVKVKG